MKDFSQGINYYDVLEVSQVATDSEIKRAYRTLSLKQFRVPRAVWRAIDTLRALTPQNSV